MAPLESSPWKGLPRPVSQQKGVSGLPVCSRRDRPRLRRRCKSGEPSPWLCHKSLLRVASGCAHDPGRRGESVFVASKIGTIDVKASPARPEPAPEIQSGSRRWSRAPKRFHQRSWIGDTIRIDRYSMVKPASKPTFKLAEAGTFTDRYPCRKRTLANLAGSESGFAPDERPELLPIVSMASLSSCQQPTRPDGAAAQLSSGRLTRTCPRYRQHRWLEARWLRGRAHKANLRRSNSDHWKPPLRHGTNYRDTNRNWSEGELLKFREPRPLRRSAARRILNSCRK